MSIDKNEPACALNSLILSASGWRGVFAASGEEEGREAETGPALYAVTRLAGGFFAGWLKERQGVERPLVLAGRDTRPTGPHLIDALIPALLASGCEVRYAGPIAAPEIMAWARKTGKTAPCAFIYVSASHNPIGHNGLKFGLDTGGVLPPHEAAPLIAGFRALFAKAGVEETLRRLDEDCAALRAETEAVKEAASLNKKEAERAYDAFTRAVITGTENPDEQAAFIQKIRAGLIRAPLSIAADFNGSARAASIDRAFLGGLGAGFSAVHETCGDIAHRIVPEGESLDTCAGFLAALHGGDRSFTLGYMPDCDGDRGNLVIWDEASQAARPLGAQEVFALAVCAELSFLVYRGADIRNTVVAINDPTSLRVDEIAARFGAKTARAEVGEANVVALAQRLRAAGKTVVPLGEGAAGGVIIYPSAVRDPLDTLGSVIKLLALRGGAGERGLFDIWRDAAGLPAAKEGWTLRDALESLPRWTTTGAYEAEALLKVKTGDAARLKEAYRRVFEREWAKKAAALGARRGMCRARAFRYNGTEEKETAAFGEAGTGGLKIIFYDKNEEAQAALWMRGSTTEPVLRVMADTRGADRSFERELLAWQRAMVQEADATA